MCRYEFNKKREKLRKTMEAIELQQQDKMKQINEKPQNTEEN
jgi:hypothetical protein